MNENGNGTGTGRASEADWAIVKRAEHGDHDAFGELYRRHSKRIYSVLLRMTGNQADAEDLTQEAFLQIHRKLSQFQGDSQLGTWMYRVAINTALMHFRKKAPPTTSLEEEIDREEPGGRKRDFGTVDHLLASSVDRVMLERTMESLPPGYRAIFVLHDIEGYEHHEIADILGCTVGNSKSQLHKARLKLFALMRPREKVSVKRYIKVLEETGALAPESP